MPHAPCPRNAKLVEHWGQSDLLGLMQQVGIIPIPGPGLILRKLYLAVASITRTFKL